MNYVPYFNLFGVEAKEIPCLTGSGAPTTATAGAVGMLYMDTDTGDLYKCTAVADGVYTWVAVSTGGAGGISNTEKTLLLALFQNAVFTSDVSAILAQLETLWSNSGESGGGDSGEDSDNTDSQTLYIVTNKLTNVTNSNSAASVVSGSSYTATLTAVDDCDMESVTVTMGGTDITEWAYSDGVINIASVTGNVVITAVAESATDITQDGSTLVIVAVPNVTQDSATLIIS